MELNTCAVEPEVQEYCYGGSLPLLAAPLLEGNEDSGNEIVRNQHHNLVPRASAFLVLTKRIAASGNEIASISTDYSSGAKSAEVLRAESIDILERQ